MDILKAAVWLAMSAGLAEASPTPEIFEPGVISSPAHDASPVFTPDGKTLYFSRGNGGGAQFLFVSHLRGGHWSQPEVAPFSGAWADMEPTMSRDGRVMIFASNRPARPGGAALSGTYQGAFRPDGGGNLWRMEARGGGWSEPVRLPDTVNRSTTIFSPSLVADGSLYFMDVSKVPPGRFQLFRSQFKDGAYQPPEPLPFSDGAFTDVDIAVAPDESFAVFSSGRPPADKSLDLFIVKRTTSGWGKPVHLGPLVNEKGSNCESRLSPDLRTLYFSSDRVILPHYPLTAAQTQVEVDRLQTWNNSLYNIWRVDLASWIHPPP